MKKEQENGDLRHGGSGQGEQAFRLALRKLNIDKFFNGKRYYFMNINVKYFSIFFPSRQIYFADKVSAFLFFLLYFRFLPKYLHCLFISCVFFFLSFLVSFSRFRVSVGFTGCFNQLAWLGWVGGSKLLKIEQKKIEKTKDGPSKNVRNNRR